MSIVFLNLGMPETRTDRNGESFITAIAKQSTQETVLLTESGLEGDSTYDEVHGTPDRGLHVLTCKINQGINSINWLAQICFGKGA